MNKKSLLVAALALASTTGMAQEVKVYDTGRKWSQAFDALIQGKSIKRIAAQGEAKAVAADSIVSVSISTKVGYAADVATSISNAGYDAETITDQLVVADIPARFIPNFSELDGVLYINAPQQLRPLMSHVRNEVGVTKVQEGTGLDSPYDGTGVLVGVIDQGFEFKHPAFKGRCKMYGTSAKSGTIKNSAPTSDPNDNSGHATHVTNIAAGNKVEGCNYYGIATGAEILPMMSDLGTTSVQRQVKAISDYAKKQGMPYVINMSFGTNLGAHDGTSQYNQELDKFSGEGAIFVAAMGNSGGDMIHASHTFTKDNETVYLYQNVLSTNTLRALATDVWNTTEGDQTKAANQIKISPIFISNGKVFRPTDEQIEMAVTTYINEIDAYNGHQHVQIQGIIDDLAKSAQIVGKSFKMYWEITGNTGQTFHAWTDYDAYPCTFEQITQNATSETPEFTTLAGNDDYLVGEGAASIPSAIAVASYNNAVSFTNLSGLSQSYANSVGKAADISAFSSKGPWLGGKQKPTVAAPGGVVISAFSKKAKNAASNASARVQQVTVDGNTFYYGVMNGTSMATPVVTGTIALWLQANPTLTPADVESIIKTTARHDSYTGRNTEWSASWGYGKIDAYEGLKEAIRMRPAGINETLNTEAPVTLQKNDDAWKVLFNNDESFANIQVVALNGQTVYSEHINAPRHGDERIINLQHFTPGVYLFKVGTTASQLTRKVVVK